MSIWKDSTTRSRGQENAPQTAWTYENKTIRVTVLSGHRIYTGEWIMHCYSLGFDTFRMKMDATTVSPQEAQEAALNIIRNRLTAVLNSLPE